MHRPNNLLAQVADPDNLRLAFWKARKGKSYTKEVEAYRVDLDKNLLDLRGDILRGAVSIGDYRYFKVFEPKERQICASAFPEQVLHHALMNICHPYFERVLISDSYASRKGKGTYSAIERAKLYSKQYGFFLKLDARQFFASIHHDVLKAQLRRLFKDYAVLGIFDQIIDSYEASPERGLPIGNLTSQYFANHYLSSLDHFIKEGLGIKAYVRYMDDMVLWHDDKEVLKSSQIAIDNFMNTELALTLKPELLNYTVKGLPFLGYQLFPHQVKLAQRSKQRFIRKLNYIMRHYRLRDWNEAYCQRRALPLFAFVEHADTEGFKRAYLNNPSARFKTSPTVVAIKVTHQRV